VVTVTLVTERTDTTSRTPVADRGRRTVSRLRRTPGRLALLMAALVVLGLATGLAGAIGVRQRAAGVDEVGSTSGRLAIAAQNLYRSLSDADATAAAAFLAGGVEPVSQRERYQADISAATAALAVVSRGDGDVGTNQFAAALARLSGQLPVYTGLIETARTYNRQGLPVGAAYLREASGLMREHLLPAAQQVYRAVTDRLDAERDDAAGFPFIAVLLGLLTLAGLGLGQRYLSRRTNRVFNLGLLAATAASVLLLLWLGTSAIVAGARLDASRDGGSAQVDLLSQARIAALQARADEALTLVARGNGQAFENDYVTVMGRLIGTDGSDGLLAQARASAADGPTRDAVEQITGLTRDWLTAHQKLRGKDNGGQYAEAVADAIGTGPESTARISSQLDDVLAQAIEHNSGRFQERARAAGGALSGLALGTVVLTVLVVAAAVLGIRRRMVEYR
jgi:hypothetical protein